jgi:hypothetical protein
MDGVTTYLLTQGVLGVVVVGLIVVCGKLYNKTEKQQARIEELQELRLQDSKEVTRDVTEVLQGNAHSNLILAEKIEVAKGRR